MKENNYFLSECDVFRVERSKDTFSIVCYKNGFAFGKPIKVNKQEVEEIRKAHPGKEVSIY